VHNILEIINELTQTGSDVVSGAELNQVIPSIKISCNISQYYKISLVNIEIKLSLSEGHLFTGSIL
jgi:hypothetical protein